MLWQRLLFGTLMIAALCGIVALDATLSARWPLLCALPVTLLVVFLAILASYELGRLVSGNAERGTANAELIPQSVVSSYQPVTHWAAFVAAGVTLIPWIEMQQERGLIASWLTTINSGASGGVALVSAPPRALPISLTMLWLTGGFMGTCLAVLGRKTTAQAVANMAVTLFIICYIGLLASFAVRVRCLWPGPAGAAILVYVLLTVKSGDIGAYFIGSWLGRHKLAPWLSPGKTIEGAVGSILAAAGVAVLGMSLWQRDGRLGAMPLNVTQAIIFGCFMAISGHLGDLLESAIKRDVGSKDSGRVVPAFGGLLDLIDSPLLAAPVAWWLLTMWTGVR